MKNKFEKLERYYMRRAHQFNYLRIAMNYHDKPDRLNYFWQCLFAWAEAMHEADEIGAELGIHTTAMWPFHADELLDFARGRA